jgi:hypothetical protein
LTKEKTEAKMRKELSKRCTLRSILVVQVQSEGRMKGRIPDKTKAVWVNAWPRGPVFDRMHSRQVITIRTL